MAKSKSARAARRQARKRWKKGRSFKEPKPPTDAEIIEALSKSSKSVTGDTQEERVSPELMVPSDARETARGAQAAARELTEGLDEDAAPRINAYTCEACGGVTVTVDRDRGVTPFIIVCRARPDCDWRATSAFYRPPDGVGEPTHEWYRPSEPETAALGESTQRHVAQGGLLLRPIDPTRREA